MSSGKIRKLKTIFTANIGCGCDPKATDIIEPKPKSSFSDQNPSSSDNSSERHGGGAVRKKSIADDDEDRTSTTFSINIHASPARSCPKIPGSFAVVKDSEDPYQDFRRSMLQMIFEKEMYSRSDLQQLLDCFLQLNSPHHHEVIVRAFMEIWNGGVAAAEGGGGAPPPCSSGGFT